MKMGFSAIALSFIIVVYFGCANSLLFDNLQPLNEAVSKAVRDTLNSYVVGSRIGDVNVPGISLTEGGFIGESGIFTARADNLDLRFPISFGSDAFLRADDTQCSCTIGGLTYNLKGGIFGSAASLIGNTVISSLKDHLNQEVCSVATDTINKNVDHITNMIPSFHLPV